MKPYLLWTDYGSEGWTYNEYATLEEVMQHIQSGISGPFIITRRLPLKVVEDQ